MLETSGLPAQEVTHTGRRVEDRGGGRVHLECEDSARIGMSRSKVFPMFRRAYGHREASPCRSCLLYTVPSQLPPFVTLGREECMEVKDQDKYGGHIPLCHVLWLIDDVFRMGSENRPQVYVRHAMGRHLVAATCFRCLWLCTSQSIHVPPLHHRFSASVTTSPSRAR